jgi:hypothetical protein
MNTVRFSNVTEFLAELERDGQPRDQLIESRIVRFTFGYKPIAEYGGSVQSMHAIATYEARGHVVKLFEHCGDHWGEQFPETQKAIDKAGEIERQISEACDRLKLDKRAGVIETDDKTP